MNIKMMILFITAFMLLIPASQAKEEVCHNGKTLSVSDNALHGHLVHGDVVGACEGMDEDELVSFENDEELPLTCSCPPGITGCTCADGSVGMPSDEPATAAGPRMMRSFSAY